MNKLRIYLLNAFLSSLIGLFVEVIWTIIQHQNSVSLPGVIESMVKAALIGTVVLFIFLHVLVRFRNKPAAGYISTFISVAVLTTIVAILDYLETPTFNYRWIFVFITAEILGLILAAVWYKQLTRYNDRLEKKKASLSDDNSPT